MFIIQLEHWLANITSLSAAFMHGGDSIKNFPISLLNLLNVHGRVVFALLD